MLGERHFFKPRTHVELGDVLSGHPVIEDKHHRYQTLDDRRIAIAAQGDHACGIAGPSRSRPGFDSPE